MKSQHPTSLELNDTKIQNIESVLKYIRLTRSIKSLDLSYTNMSIRPIQKLTRALVTREIHISTLTLSRNLQITDEVCTVISHLFSERSSIKHLHLDDTSVT